MAWCRSGQSLATQIMSGSKYAAYMAASQGKSGISAAIMAKNSLSRRRAFGAVFRVCLGLLLLQSDACNHNSTADESHRGRQEEAGPEKGPCRGKPEISSAHQARSRRKSCNLAGHLQQTCKTLRNGTIGQLLTIAVLATQQRTWAKAIQKAAAK